MAFIREISRYMNNGCLFSKLKINSVSEMPGVYLIGLAKGVDDIKILNDTTAIKTYNGEDMIFHNTEELYEKWKRGNKVILSIGQTNNLRRRVKQFYNYALGKSDNHRGESVLWQVENWQDIYRLYWSEADDNGLKSYLLNLHIFDYTCETFANGNKH